ncbi:MAG TPA: hypothetical protein ENK23_04165 [Sorangium sp.]|nr:hypothetical protein [Sorangium sp.]
MLAITLSLFTRSLNLEEATKGMLKGMTLMFEALVILILAWALSAAMKELGAPAYLVATLSDSIAPWMLPTVVFLVGAGISFAVGSSYTTMGIMMPMVVPLAFTMLANDAAADPALPLMASGSVLAGACFGDHCSPISDTTILSSIGSGCELLAHVRTQLPYALAVGVISVLCGTLPAGLGVNPWVCLALSVVASGALLRFVGKPAPAAPAAP